MNDSVETPISEVVATDQKVTKLALDDVEDFIAKNENVVLDLYADWCKPCKEMAPIFEELAKKYEGKIAFGKVDCMEDKERVKAEYKIKFIPTFILLKKRKIPIFSANKEYRFSATKTHEELSEIFEKYFKL